MYARYLKGAIDRTLASIGLVALSPMLAVLGALVWRKLGQPILFKQVRPGLNGEPFTMIKFRTMRDAFGADGEPLQDADRLTPFGAFLRATSLDELPELWNVVRGDMSLVGPRPLLMRYLDRYTPDQTRRHDVRPGLTGLAQVSGRNALTWEDKFAYDLWYVENHSFEVDIRILARTVLKVIQREGVDAGPGVTAHEFMGEADNAHIHPN